MADDTEFLTVFATGRRSNKNATGASAREGDDESVRLNPQQRRINAARRKHVGAVNTLVKRHELARSLALDGIEAATQAASQSIPAPLPVTVVPAARPDVVDANFGTLREAYNQVTSLESSNAADEDILKGWQLVLVISRAVINNTVTSKEDLQGAFRAEMTAYTHMAALYQHKGQIKTAIKMNEQVLELAFKVRRDDRTLLAIVGVLENLQVLHAGIGNIDKAAKYASLAANVEKRRKGGKPISTVQAETAAPPPVSHPIASAPLVQALVTNIAAPAPPVTSLSVLFPDYDAIDKSPEAVANRTLKKAMLDNDFDPLVALLNQSLVKKGSGIDFRYRLPVLGISFLMVAASADRHDVIRRLLAQLPPALAANSVVQEVDHAGANAIIHAAAVGQVRALDELLRGAAGNPDLRSLAPVVPPATLYDRLPLLGITSDRFSSFPDQIKSQLSSFVASPSRYLDEFRAPILGAAPPAIMPSLPFPPAGLPFPALPYAGYPPAVAMAMLMSQLAAFQLSMGQQALPPVLPVNQAASVAAFAPASTTQSQAAAPAASKPPSGSWADKAKSTAARAEPEQSTSKGGVKSGKGNASYSNVSRAAGEGKLAGRALQPYAVPAVGGVTELLEGCHDPAATTSWDQFAANEALFGVKATYREELYTSKLDLTKFTPAQLAQADQLAKAIQDDEAGLDNPHIREERGVAAAGEEEDEETKFAAVVRKGKGKSKPKGDAFTDAGVASRAAGNSGTTVQKAVDSGDASVFFSP